MIEKSLHGFVRERSSISFTKLVHGVRIPRTYRSLFKARAGRRFSNPVRCVDQWQLDALTSEYHPLLVSPCPPSHTKPLPTHTSSVSPPPAPPVMLESRNRKRYITIVYVNIKRSFQEWAEMEVPHGWMTDERGLNSKVWRLGPCRCEDNGEFCLVGAKPIALFLPLSLTVVAHISTTELKR